MDNDLRLMFYRAKGTFLDRAIRWFTKSPYSHVEIDFGAENGGSFSSSFRDGGVRFKDIDFKEDRWDEIKVYVDDPAAALRFARSVVGKKYGTWEVVRFLFPFMRERKNEWFCSEVCLRAIQEGGRFRAVNPSRVSPGDLAKILRFHS